MSTRNTGRSGDSIVFHGCSATSDASAAPRAGGQRRQTVIKGKRVKTIDVHAHCDHPESVRAAGPQHRRASMRPDIDEVGPKRIAEMDAQGIDIEAISINPFWYQAERDVADRSHARSRTRRSPNSARSIPTASSPSHRSRCSTPSWPCSSSSTA